MLDAHVVRQGERILRVIMVGATALSFVVPTSAVGQVPRIAPPPPCRVDRINDPLLRLALPSSRTPALVVMPFTQGIVERKYSHVPWLLSERVRERLRLHNGLTVPASGQTARALFESGGSADSARRLLGATWMLVGAVEAIRLDTQIRIQLISGASPTPAWEGTFALSASTLTAIEETILDSVSARVARQPPASRRILRPSDPEHDHRLSAARFLLTEHTLTSAEAARKDLETLFASDTAPVIATALARATVLTLERGGLLPPEPPVPALRRVEALVSYVLARDSGNAEAWTIRAMAARYGDPAHLKGAEAAHRRAVALDPRSADASHQYAVTLLQLGRLNEARARLRRALDLDHGHAAALGLLAELERRAERPQLACGFANASIAADPFDPHVYGTRALARLQLAQAREAYADAETAMRLTDDAWAEGIRLMVEVAGANTSLAQSLGRQYAQQFVASRAMLTVEDALSLARAFAALGFYREAEGALLKARPAGVVLRHGLSEKVFSPMRGRPAFDSLVKSISSAR